MKKKVRRTLLSLIFVLLSAHIAHATDIAVSLTIPAIPGVNAPLLEEQTIQPQKNTAKPQENTIATNENTTMTQENNTIKATEPQNSVTEQISTQVQQEAQDQKTLIFVKTFYDR